MSTFEPCTLDDVADALNYLDFNHRDTWVRTAFAIKSEFGDGGFSTWEDWGSQYNGYKKAEGNGTWKSAKAGGGITIKTLFKEARDNGYRPRELDDSERKRLQQEQTERSARVAKEREEDEKRHAELQNKVARIAQVALEKCTVAVGRSEYLGRKQVGAHGVRFFKHPVLFVVDQDMGTANYVTQKDSITTYFNMPEEKRPSIRYAKRGVLAVPMCNEHGNVVNLQLIFASGKKSFLKAGRKEGCYHLIGSVDPESDISTLVITEGYATGASIHEATGLPVAVAFDAGNLVKVGKLMRERYPSHTLIFAGDDDWETEQETGKNPGREKANAAANAVGGVVVIPKFKKAVA